MPKFITIQIEAIVTRVDILKHSFTAMLSNTLNGKGHVEVTCRLKPGQPIPRRGQAVLLDAKTVLISARRARGT